MRILVLIHEFPPIGGGGGRVAYDISRKFVADGHQVVLLTSHYKGLAREEEVDGIRVFRIPSLRKEAYQAGFWSMAAYVLLGLVAGSRLIRQWKPQLIHVHFAVPAGALAWALSRLHGLPYVLTTHLGDVPGGVPEKTDYWFRLVAPFTPRIWRDAARVVAVSRYTRDLACARYPVDIQIIPNGVDLVALDPGTIRVGGPPRIVFAGRLVPQKNPLGLIEVLAGLRDLPWECVLIGEGQLGEQVRAAIRRHKLEARFTHTGWIRPDEVLAWFARSDILFMPSLSEGLPVVGVQALAMGLAVVASRVGGFVDIVDQGRNGFLFLPDRTDEMRAALRSLLGNREALLQARLASRALAAQFDLSKIVGAYEQVFEGVIDSSRP